MPTPVIPVTDFTYLHKFYPGFSFDKPLYKDARNNIFNIEVTQRQCPVIDGGKTEVPHTIIINKIASTIACSFLHAEGKQNGITTIHSEEIFTDDIDNIVKRTQNLLITTHKRKSVDAEEAKNIISKIIPPLSALEIKAIKEEIQDFRKTRPKIKYKFTKRFNAKPSKEKRNYTI